MSKIAIIYHSIDLDGYMSAAIVKHWFISKLKNNESYKINGTIHDRGGNINLPIEFITFMGYNYGQLIPDLSEYDKVIMCDISFPKEEMRKLRRILWDDDIQKDNLVFIDHHISAINDSIDECYNGCAGLRDTKFAACELTWKYFFPNESMPEIVRLLGRYDCFGHKGTSEEQTVLEFQYGARIVISNYDDAYHALKSNINFGNSFCDEIHSCGITIYTYLCQEAKQIYADRFNLYFDIILKDDNNIPNCKMKLKFAAINRNRFNPINFGIDYHTDGYDGVACFWIVGTKIHFSLYNDNSRVDCSAIAKKYGGGGHKGAAEFIIDTANLNIPFDLQQILNT